MAIKYRKMFYWRWACDSKCKQKNRYTCKHHCLYCYANFSKETVEKQTPEHDVNSPLLIGNLTGYEKITNREIKSFRVKEEQIKLDLP